MNNDLTVEQLNNYYSVLHSILVEAAGLTCCFFLFAIIGLDVSPFVYKINFNMNHSVLMSLGIIAAITLPFITVGVLFIVSHYLKKKF